jgi:hypothetical protein
MLWKWGRSGAVKDSSLAFARRASKVPEVLTYKALTAILFIAIKPPSAESAH